MSGIEVPLINDDNSMTIENVSQNKSKKESGCNQIVAGMAIMSTDFNFFIINMVLVLLKEVHGEIDNKFKSLLATLCLIGAIFGQISFGYIGDKIGRKLAMNITMLLTMVGAIGSALSFHYKGFSLYSCLAMWRFILGLGCGGVYPLSATLSAESAEKGQGSSHTAWAFAQQGTANVLSPLICIILVLSFQNDYDLVWRYALGCGAIFGAIILVLPKVETSHTKTGQNQNENKPSLLHYLKQKEYIFRLIGTAGSWFCFDLTFYSNILFGPVIIDKILPTNTPLQVAYQYLVVATIGLPGYFVAAYFMKKLGSRVIQLQGFLMMSLIYIILGTYLDYIKEYIAILLILYGLSFFFSNFGPNSSTFLLSTETYPNEIRSTFNGISAACGKVGASLAGLFFAPLNDKYGSNFTFVMCGIIAFCGFLVTFFFVHNPKITPRLSNLSTIDHNMVRSI